MKAYKDPFKVLELIFDLIAPVGKPGKEHVDFLLKCP